MTALATFGVCTCGHPIYDHGRIGLDGNQVYVGCRVPNCPCVKWLASDGSLWPNGPAAA